MLLQMGDKSSITVRRAIFAADLAVVCSTGYGRRRGIHFEKYGGAFLLEISAVNRLQDNMACTHSDGVPGIFDMCYFHRNDNWQRLMVFLQFFQDGDPIKKWQMEI